MKKSIKKIRPTVLFSLVALLSTGSVVAGSQVSIGDPGITDTLFTGTAAYHGGNLGQSVVSGDFNGDGITDLVLGAPGMKSPRGTGEEGLVFVYFGGSNSGIGALPDKVTTQDGKEDLLFYGVKGYVSPKHGERAGEMLAAGDLNGDGYDDLTIVAQAGDIDHHKMYVIYGGASMVDGSLANADVIVTRSRGANVPSTWATFSVSSITSGDLNSDGYDDLVLSDRVNNRFEVLLGSNSKWNSTLDLSTDTDITYVHSKSTDSFSDLNSDDYFPLNQGGDGAIAGVAVGNINGDGFNDLVMGLPNETATVAKSGRLYLILGTPGKFDPQPTPVEMDMIPGVVLIDGALPGDKAGGPLAMGNVNGDKNGARDISDLIIGQPVSMQGVVNSSGFGQAQVLLGRNPFPAKIDLFDDTKTSTLRIKREVDEGGFADKGFYTGTAVLATDINGDGIDDITVTSPGATFDSAKGHGHGWVQTVYGSPAFASKTYFLATDADLWTTTPVPVDPLAGGYTGSSVTSGDYNDDGKPDLAMGAPKGHADGTVTSGYVPLLLGASGKIGCSGEFAVVEDSFASGSTYTCEGTKTLVTSGDVVVEAGATVKFYSPSITLNSGFKVVVGGVFSANDVM